MPLPGLLYAQVVKQYRRKRMGGVKHHVVFGTLGAIEQVLSGWGWKINTAFVERLNLDLRQRVAAIGRRGNTLCQGEGSLQHQLALFHAYHNLSCHIRAGASRCGFPRRPLAVARRRGGDRVRRRWRPD